MATANNICFDIATLGQQHSTIYKFRLMNMIQEDKKYNMDEENNFLKKHLKLPCDCGGIDEVHYLNISRKDLKNKKTGNASFIGSYCNIRGSHFLKNPKHKQLKNLKSGMRTDKNKPYAGISECLDQAFLPNKGESFAKLVRTQDRTYHLHLFDFEDYRGNRTIAMVITNMRPSRALSSCTDGCHTQIKSRCPNNNIYGPDRQFKSRCDCINYYYYDRPIHPGCEKCAYDYCCGSIDGCNVVDPAP